MTGNLSPSLIRTLVPFLIGGLGSWAARHGLDINDDGAATILTVVIGYLYYVVARFLEVYSGAKWGYILGIAKAPGYTPGDPVKGAPVGEPSDHGAGELRLVGLVVIGVIVALVLWALLTRVL